MLKRSFLRVQEDPCTFSDLTALAMQKTGCTWTGVTVSKQQLEEAVAKVKAAGLSDSIKLLFCDYREGHELGTFDKVRSPRIIARAHCNVPPTAEEPGEGVAPA